MMNSKKVSPLMEHFSAVEALQKEAFPPNESYSMEQILALSDSPNIQYLSFWEADTLCGLLFYNVGETMIYLFYLAVNPAIRSKGYGGKLLRWLRDRYADKVVVGNIEPIGFGADNDIISSGSSFSEEEYMRLITELGFDAYHPKLLTYNEFK